MKKIALYSIAFLLLWCCSLAIADASNVALRPGAPTQQVFADENKTIAIPDQIAVNATPVAEAAATTSNKVYNPKLQQLIESKPPITVPPPVDPHVILQGGDTVDDATVISTLPYSNTGTTVGYADNYDSAISPCYATSTSPDVVYSYTPASTVVADVTLCTNSAYDTKLFIMQDVAGNVVACHDDDCSTPSFPSSWVSMIPGFNFVVGHTYYIVVDGYGGEAGSYTIDVVPPGLCTPDFVVTAPGSWSGTLAGAGDDCNLRSGQDHIYEITIPYEADWEFSFCSGPISWDAYMYLGTTCCGSDLGFNDDGCTGANEMMPIMAAHLTAGTYYVDFEPYSVGYENAYTFTVSEVVPCVVTCPPGGINEVEDNGGCNSAPPVFNNIADGQTVCGMGWEDASFRDTDWYLFTLTENKIVTLTMTAEFNYIFGIIVPFSSDPCDNSGSLTYYAFGGPCDTLTVQALLGATPGVYVAFVAPISGIFTDLPYWMSMTLTTPPPPPVNDNCTAVTPGSLTPATPLTYVGNNAWASSDCSLLGWPEVWHSFTTSEELNVTVDFCTTAPAFTTIATVLTECPCLATLPSTSYNFTTCGDGNGSIIWQHLPAGTYYYPVYSGGVTGDYTVHITGVVPPPPPPNDDCAGAILVTIPSTTAGNTSAATLDAVATCGTNISAAGIWYNVVGNGNTITASTCDLGTNYDTKINVYCNTCEQPVCVGGNDDNCALPSHSLNSSVTWCSEAGTTYRILVQGFSGQTGDFNLVLSDDGTPCSTPPSCVPPPNDNCADVTPQPLIGGTPLVFTGDNGGATPDCDSNGYAEVWISFTTTECMNVSINSCGTVPALNWIGTWIWPECPCANHVFSPSYNWADCGDGNWTINYDFLPAGTWYYPLISDPGYNPTGPYTITVNGAVCPLPVFGVNPTFVTGSAEPGGNDSQVLHVTNSGNVPLTADISVSIDPPALRAGLPRSSNPQAFFNNAKTPASYIPPPPEPGVILQGGDNVGNATVIPSLPYSDAGTIVGYTNDYEEVCPYSSTSPDVVYSFTATVDSIVNITLCNGSDYDTKLFVYENTVGNLAACNDDACPGYISEISAAYNAPMAVIAPNTYYIVVDGYGGDAGNYVIDVSYATPPPPPPGCPAEGVLFGANPTLPGDPWNFLTSDTEPAPAGYKVFENFSGIFGTIEEVHWWGIDAYNSGGWFECDAATEDFEITFYQDDGGIPGAQVGLYTVTVTPVATGGNFSGFIQKEYQAAITPAMVLTQGWISIQAITSGDLCWFLWQNTLDITDGNSLQYDGSLYNSTGEDLSICLIGTYVAPWLTTDLNFIEVPVGGDVPLTVNMSAATLDEGAYTGNVIFNTNEMVATVHTVPVTFNVGTTGACDYMPGDINNNGFANGIDVVYGVTYLKGGTPPLVDCNPPCVAQPEPFFAAMDVNGNCSANGIDITFYVAYLKGLNPALRYCAGCPPARFASPGQGSDRPAIVPTNRTTSNQQ